MSPLLPLLVAGGVVLLAAGRRRGSGATVTLTTADFGDYGPGVAAVSLRVGETLEVRMPSQGGVPYGWDMEGEGDADLVETMSTLPCPESMPGCTSTDVYRYLALSPGEALITATYSSFIDDDEPPVQQHVIPVTVAE